MVNVYHQQLDRLREILVTQGTAFERDLVERAIMGELTFKEEFDEQEGEMSMAHPYIERDIQRLKILGRQFLNEDIEV